MKEKIDAKKIANGKVLNFNVGFEKGNFATSTMKLTGEKEQFHVRCLEGVKVPLLRRYNRNASHFSDTHIYLIIIKIYLANKYTHSNLSITFT